MRRFTSITAALLLLACASAAVPAADPRAYPTKPIRMIVASPPAGPADIVARVIGPRLTEAWGQTVVIDNRAGANGIVGTELAVRSAPDGYTVLMVAAGLAINPSLYGKVPFDALRDLAPVTQAIAVSNTLVVHPSVPARSVQALVSTARQKTGGLTFASAGNGTSGHLALELFRQTAKVDLTHVPYKGEGPALIDLVAGRVDLFIGNISAVVRFRQERKVKFLAMASARRAAVAGDVPTSAEAGLPGFEASAWFGVVAPPGTPAAIAQKLQAAIAEALQKGDVQDKVQALGGEVSGIAPPEFAAFMAAERLRWKKVIESANVTVD